MKKVLVRGPALSQSGYGEHTRFILRSLRSRPELFDIFLINIPWGQTGWIWENNEERKWIDFLLEKTINYGQQGGQFDSSLQVTIPNEFEKIAPINIGVTAGIETTKIAPQWIEGGLKVDRMIVVSEHAKYGLRNTEYLATNNSTGEEFMAKISCPIDVVGYPVKKTTPEKIDLKLKYDFNFLVIGTWIVRKNLENTIKWFVEEFYDQEVGLVIKTSLIRNCLQDREATDFKIKQLLQEYKGRKCQVYLLHGDMNEGEMASLYQHPQIKALVNFSHGEGFGLPLFEAAYSGLPVIAPNWGGQCDFLYITEKNKKGKIKKTPMFSSVSYDIKPIQPEAHWEGVIQKDSQWCFPKEWNCKKTLRSIKKDYGTVKSKAKKLQTYLKKEFSEEKQYQKIVKSVFPEAPELEDINYVFVADMFAEQYNGGAELSLEALIQKTPDIFVKLNANMVNEKLIDFYKDKKWVFGNFTSLDKGIMKTFIENKIKYYVIDSDYHFCKHRLAELCKVFNAEKDCYCVERTDHGKSVKEFIQHAELVFYRSEKQRDYHLHKLSLKAEKAKILTSTLDDDSLELIKELRKEYKDKKDKFWVISSSPSWVKGTAQAKAWCNENNKDFVELHGKTHKEALDTLAKAEGLCFLPNGDDTCPRLVIEAKLLGCKIETNDKVLHMEEKWFKTDNLDKIESYLRKISKNFWKTIESR